eukprot:gnl/MRDRNA2_/MRDRNA2_80090_c0_seq1.p1 gnl/MRDRNA2_/MRDRNA2_80090_c0~~gnl/MRDRNA2_/MRDRNA2_80090_c0_seq1.p1  ORF type:complete len:101 (+),score=15.31 gnl/MRDRNA2_/MRDRNA2_80090_c0_seq1:311-613(+)
MESQVMAPLSSNNGASPALGVVHGCALPTTFWLAKSKTQTPNAKALCNSARTVLLSNNTAVHGWLGMVVSCALQVNFLLAVSSERALDAQDSVQRATASP